MAQLERKTNMKKQINKAQEIRNYLAKHPQARPRDVIAALATRKIKVTSGQVSNIRSKPKPADKASKIQTRNGLSAAEIKAAAQRAKAKIPGKPKANSDELFEFECETSRNVSELLLLAQRLGYRQAHELLYVLEAAQLVCPTQP
jgi:hypothetical protein